MQQFQHFIVRLTDVEMRIFSLEYTNSDNICILLSDIKGGACSYFYQCKGKPGWKHPLKRSKTNQIVKQTSINKNRVTTNLKLPK